jgi:hypothetical protein
MRLINSLQTAILMLCSVLGEAGLSRVVLLSSCRVFSLDFCDLLTLRPLDLPLLSFLLISWFGVHFMYSKSEGTSFKTPPKLLHFGSW